MRRINNTFAYMCYKNINSNNVRCVYVNIKKEIRKQKVIKKDSY